MKDMNQNYQLAASLAKSIFRKESPFIPDDAFAPDSEYGLLLAGMRRMVDEGKINECEDMLFNVFDQKKSQILAIGIEFYARLSQMPEGQLEDCDFSTEEVKEGISDMLKAYNVRIAPPPTPLMQLAGAVAKNVFGSDTPLLTDTSLDEGSEAAALLAEIHGMMNEKKLSEAAAKLKTVYNKEKKEIGRVALDFYARLMPLSKETLEQLGYPVETLREDFSEFLQVYEIRVAPVANPLMQLVAQAAKQGFGADTPLLSDKEFEEGSDAAKLLAEVRGLIGEKKLVEAKKRLEAQYDKENKDVARIALDFFGRLAPVKPELLKTLGYPVEEMQKDFDALLQKYEIKVVMPQNPLMQLLKFLAKGMFKKETPILGDKPFGEGSDAAALYEKIHGLIEGKKLAEADELLKKSYQKEKMEIAEIALDFYGRLAPLPGSLLEQLGFPQAKIQEGLSAMLEAYGIQIQVKKKPEEAGDGKQ